MTAEMMPQTEAVTILPLLMRITDRMPNRFSDEAEHGRDEHRGDDAESAHDFLRDGSGLVDGDVVTA